MKTAVKELISI